MTGQGQEERGAPGPRVPETRTRPPVVTSVSRAKAWGERGGGVTLEGGWMQLGDTKSGCRGHEYPWGGTRGREAEW